MHGFTLVFLGFALSTAPVELHSGEFEIQTRQFAMPLMFLIDKRENIERIRLFVSEDRGKSWKHEKDYKPTVEKVTFTALDDGSLSKLYLRMENASPAS